MRKNIYLCLTIILVLSVSAAVAQDGMETIKSRYSVEKTADRFEKSLNKKGITIFKKVDHEQGAASVDMKLRPTILFIFGNPKLGTPIMQCSQTVAIDLPQKMLIWEASGGEVNISYNSIEYLKKRHNIENCDAAFDRISRTLHNFARNAAGAGSD